MKHSPDGVTMPCHCVRPNEGDHFYATCGGKETVSEMSDDEKLLNTFAMMCHEINRAYCHSTGDDSQPPWDEAPEWQRKATISALLSGRATTPEERHQQWCDDKFRDGWKWGSVKDPVAMTHPCLVSYDMLPHEQRTKDALMNVVVEGYHTLK